ncbi:hypothetical protein NDU88_003335 [Pleurodeles waltl]|uniref:Uncharacterized protein n=1 Tax=Pleurodeles waltl TaxID=8319 RepID=A0AAV7V112_PLEWA|nr:hypothetical protein NDU88_003335 [Pleurodeles waltl]
MFPNPSEAAAVLGLWVPVAGGAREAPVPRASRSQEEGERPRGTDAALPLPAGRLDLRRARSGAPVPRGGERREEQGRRLRSPVTRFFRRAEGGEARSPARGCQVIVATAQSSAVGLGAIFLGPWACKWGDRAPLAIDAPSARLTALVLCSRYLSVVWGALGAPTAPPSPAHGPPPGRAQLLGGHLRSWPDHTSRMDTFLTANPSSLTIPDL